MDINYAKKLFDNKIVRINEHFYILLIVLFLILSLVMIISLCKWDFYFYAIPFTAIILWIVYFFGFQHLLLEDVTLKVKKSEEGFWHVQKDHMVLPLPRFYIMKEGRPRIEFKKGRVDKIVPILYVDD